MSPKMNLGFNVLPDASMPKIINWCQEIEKAGFRLIGMADSQLLSREFFICYAAGLMSTSHASFIPLVSNPLTRHPSIAASAIFSLHELGPGRVSLGLGAGDSAVYPLGMRQAKVDTIRDYVNAVRRLLNGEVATWRGANFRAMWADWEPPTPIKIYVAANGPRTIKMAAQVADGVFFDVGVGAMADSVQYCIDLANEGAREVGRDPAEVEHWWHLPLYLAESREAALLPMGSLGVQFLVRGTMEGKQIPDEYKPALKRLYAAAGLDTHSPEARSGETADPKLGELTRELGLMEFMIQRNGDLVGTPDDINRALGTLYDRGIRNLVLFPLGEDIPGIARVLGKEVLPNFA